MINLVVALNRDNLIGLDGTLPWSNRPEDMKNFASLTRGHTVVMGRKTFDSINNKPLLDRYNIILTTKEVIYWNSDFKGWSHQRVFNRYSVKDVVELIEDLEPKEVFIIGGMQVYKSFAHLVERMYITVIDEYQPPLNGREAIYFPWTAFSGSSWKCAYQSMLGSDFYYVYDRL